MDEKLSVVGRYTECASIVVILPLVGWLMDGGGGATLMGMCGVLIGAVVLISAADFVCGSEDA